MNKQVQDARQFITQWMVAGPKCTPYTAPDLPTTWENQLEYEKNLRGIFFCPSETPPVQSASIGAQSPLGMPWRYYYNQDNWFLDFSTFYSLLTHVQIMAETILHSETGQMIDAQLWSYSMVQVWVNGVLAAQNDRPVYKPMQCIPFTLPLCAGENRITIVSHNLGVRDTRDIVGICLMNMQGVRNLLLDEPTTNCCEQAADWLRRTCLQGNRLHVPFAPKFPARVVCENKTTPVTGSVLVAPETAKVFYLEMDVAGQTMRRPLQCIEQIQPRYFSQTHKNAIENVCRAIAAKSRERRSPEIYFSVYNILARFAYKAVTPQDEAFLLEDLDWVDRRIDCADFLVIGLLRLAKRYTLPPRVQARMREVLLRFRYWMDESGSDGMCFWSENHALMFYGAQMIAGELYPDDDFLRSGRTGRQQYETGAARCRDWLDNVERDGVEEFNSATYMPVTITALLHLIDFAPQDIAVRAKAVLDSILRQFSVHVFCRSIISPQGRVYRDVIHPSQQTAQGLLNLICPDYPYADTENMWYACFLTSGYRFPDNLRAIMDHPRSGSYTSANVRIEVEKTAHYMLTSVRSPRALSDTPHWKNLCFANSPDKNSNLYVKSLNECFHGTSVIEPGVFGYQQHLWYAALSNTAVVFVTNPGSPVDCDSMRPGYWYGNLVFPALQQDKNTLVCVYSLPKEISVRFTHVFFPHCYFDEVVESGNWLFASCGEGLLALWCSGALIKHNDVLHDCEYRCYDSDCAYVCTCSDTSTDRSLSEFAQRVMRMPPAWNQDALRLKMGTLCVQYAPHTNPSQYI